MSQIAIPDTAKWLEVKKINLLDKNKRIVGVSRYYIQFNLKYLDDKKQPRKHSCMVVSFFGAEKSALMWTDIKKVKGKIVELEYAAVLLDQKTNTWAIGKLGKEWEGEIDYDENQKTVGTKISIETESGIKSAYFCNPKS